MTAPTDRTGAGRAPVAPPVLGEPGLTVPPAVAPGPGSPPDAGGPVLRGAGPLVITVHGKPATQGSKRPRPIFKGRAGAKTFTGKVAMVEESKEKHKAWREAVKEAAEAALIARSALTYGGPAQAGLLRIVDSPVFVSVTFCFDKPKSAPKRRRVWPITRSTGDIDKLLRSSFDALTDAGVLKDDSQIVEVIARKLHTDDEASPLHIPGALIVVRGLTPEGTT